jgi:protein gp37
VVHAEKLDDPVKLRKKSRIFVCSTSDLFHESIDAVHIDAVFSRMVHPMSGMAHHTYIVLTKRIERLFNDPHCRPEHFAQWPNVWLGVTVENQARAEERIPLLLRVPAAKRFLSIEPMLGPVDLTRVKFPTGVYENVLKTDVSEYAAPIIGKLHGIDWVICGPENGPRNRHCDTRWIADVQLDCHTWKVPFFDKRDDAGSVREWPT